MSSEKNRFPHALGPNQGRRRNRQNLSGDTHGTQFPPAQINAGPSSSAFGAPGFLLESAPRIFGQPNPGDQFPQEIVPDHQHRVVSPGTRSVSPYAASTTSTWREFEPTNDASNRGTPLREGLLAPPMMNYRHEASPDPWYIAQLNVENPEAQDDPTATDAEPLKCQWVGCTSSDIFRRREDLLRHVRTLHIFSKDFECGYCHRRFNRRDNRTAHIRRVHVPQS